MSLGSAGSWDGLTQVLWGPDHTILDKTAETMIGGRVALG